MGGQSERLGSPQSESQPIDGWLFDVPGGMQLRIPGSEHPSPFCI